MKMVFGARRAGYFRARLAVPLLFLLLLPACGKKGPVRPKLLPVPAAPAPVVIEQRGAFFLVSWKIPRSNQDGSQLTDLKGFRVSRMRYIPGEECPDCRPQFTPVREVDLDYLQGVRQQDDRLYWWDEQPEPDYGYVYQVVAMTADGRPGIPAEQRRLFIAIPPPPQGLQATGFDRLVRLRWEAPIEIPGKFLGYYVYRREAGAPVPLLPVNQQPLAETAFEDFGPENGRTYLYTVSLAIQERGYTAESSPTVAAEATPQAGK